MKAVKGVWMAEDVGGNLEGGGGGLGDWGECCILMESAGKSVAGASYRRERSQAAWRTIL